jgi:hypothetical protein
VQEATDHPLIENESLAITPEEAMTLPLLPAMFRVVFAMRHDI